MRKSISLLFACTIMCMFFTGNALAYTAYSYGTLYLDIDTRPAAQNVNSRLNSIGYSSSYQPSVSAATAYSQMQNANVWFFNGHGGNGYIAFYNPGYRYITGTLHNPPYDNAISQLTGGVLNDCALAVFVACGSGNSDATMGNLLDQSQMNGVDTALGFSGVLDAAKSDYWAQ